MITAFGKFCRKLRIDRGQIMRDMANVLGVSPAFLSAVETGKRNAPLSWVSIIADNYQLNSDEKNALILAIEHSTNEIRINLRNRAESDQELVRAFAREFTSLGSEKKQQILDLLKSSRTVE